MSEEDSSRSRWQIPGVVIIGAGFSGKGQAKVRTQGKKFTNIITGICAAIDLIRFNNTRDFLIIERGDHVGGTWNYNRYPGCGADGTSRPLSCGIIQ